MVEPGMTPPVAPPQPHWMSVWLIHYCAAAAVRHALTGIAVLGWPQLFISAAFMPIVDYTHLWTLGVGYLVAGIVIVSGLASRSVNLTRWGMIVSSSVNGVTTFALSWGVIGTWISPTVEDASPFVPLLLLAITYKDLILVRNPLNDPISDYLETIDREEGRGRG